MFLCDDCVQPDDYVSIFRSYGKCEGCDKEASCYDVDIHRK